MRTPEQTEALQQLYRVAEEAPEELLHMRAVVEKASCGTARCLLGWAIIDPWFQKNTIINDILPPDWNERILPSHKESFLDEIFGINCEDTDNLFALNMHAYADEHAVSKDEVLWNLRELIAGNSALPYEATEDYVPVYASGIENPEYEE